MSLTLLFPGLGAERPLRSDRLATLLPTPVPVRKGGLIARTVPAGEEGAPTLAVRGRVDDLAGEGVVVKRGETPETASLVAARDGYLAERDGTLVVTSRYEIFRDVDNQTGDIAFAGTVRIHGGVLAGRSVTVGGDLEILGLVEAARVKADGNLLLRGGIAGGDEGIGMAGRDLFASYAQQATLEAVGSIVLEGPAMNAHLTAGKKIVLKGRASVVGGTLRAREEIVAPVVGSESAVPTDIALGYDPFHGRMVRELSAEREALDNEREMAHKGIAFAAEKLAPPPPLAPEDILSNVFALSDLIRTVDDETLGPEQAKYRHELGNVLMEALDVERRREELEASVGEQAAPCPSASLKVERVAHPGVTVSILAHTLLLDREYERVKFIVQGDGIAPVNL